MRPQTLIKIVAYAVAGVYALILLIVGVRLPSTATKIASAIPVVLVVLFAAFDAILWSWPPLRYLIRGRPRINGTWAGELTPVEAGGTDPSGALPIVLVIRETFTDLSITLTTEESRSRSLAASIIRHGSGDFSAYYTYENVPAPLFRDGSPIHFGGVVIDISGLEPSAIAGSYWTDRRTRGSFKVEKVTKKHVDSFREAKNLKGFGGD
jgi:hypothetical protein